MTKPKLDEGSPSLTPHGDVLEVPDEEPAPTGKARDKLDGPEDIKERPQPRGDDPANR